MTSQTTSSRRFKWMVRSGSLLVAAALAGPAVAAQKELLQSKPMGEPVAEAAAPPAPVKWTKHQLSDQFFSEGATAGDFNHDGKLDVAAGPFWYEGPDFAKRHQFYGYTDDKGGPKEPAAFDPHGYSDNFLAFTYDFNGDGWDDILVYGFPGKDASWFENPKDASSTKPWKRHLILEVVDSESPGFMDITGDGKPDLICGNSNGKDPGALGYATADWSDPAKPWTFHAVTNTAKGYFKFTHGIGAGDVNGDGRVDLLEKGGWWEHPADEKSPWKLHPATFGTGGAQMYAYDVNGDGKNDVISSIAAHGFGLVWYEQKSPDEFVPHLIMGDKPELSAQRVKFSQLHAIDLVDIDGDGLKDIVTGKRYWAHGPTGDVEPGAPAVLYWFKLVREGGNARFIAYPIDDNSGIGTQVMAVDLNGDKRPDIVVGNKKGAFVHIQQPAAQTSHSE